MINNKRKQDTIKVLEQSLTGVDKSLRCEHCKERTFLQPKKGDNNNLFCLNCGNLTPVRTIRHARGLTAPTIQQPTAIVQSQATKRKPRGINRDKSELEQALLNRGYQIIDVNYVEPVPR